MSIKKLKSRIAPTPSGFLHLGNGLSFLMTWAKTRAVGGQLLLRIDDMDKARCRPEYIKDIFETLEWLGIDYDQGPSGPDDFDKNWSQHHRLDRYMDGLNVLRDKALLFACNCSRKQINEANTGRKGFYSGRCLTRNLAFDTPEVAWRLKLESQVFDLKMYIENDLFQLFSSRNIDHLVVRQKNEMPAYQLTSLLDDVFFEVNYIVRGEDLLSSSWAQLYLANQLELTSFLTTQFWHHPLILDDVGVKLSKSKGANSLKIWREGGKSPQKIIQMAAQQLGLTEQVEKADDLVALLRTKA